MWPRSNQKLTIRLFEGTPTSSRGARKQAGWRVDRRDPQNSHPPGWVAESLPLIRTNDSLRCTLEHAFFGLATPPKRATDANRHCLTFDLAGAGEETAAVLVPRFTSDSPGEVGSRERCFARHLWQPSHA